MIAKTIVFVSVALGLAAGCFDFRPTQSCGSVNIPCGVQPVAQQVCADNVFSTGSCGSCGSCGSYGSCGTTESCGCGSCGASLVSGSVFNNAGDNVFGGNFLSSGNQQATDGPETPGYPVVQAPPVTLPAVEGPLVTLSSPPIPAPRVIAQRCICTKTIVKPQVIQRCVTVPKIQRYLKRTVTPVVENIAYKSKPINTCCGSSVEQSPVVLSNGCGSCQAGYINQASPASISTGSCGSSCSRIC